MLVLLLKNLIRLNWRLLHNRLFRKWLLPALSRDYSRFKLLNCWWGDQRVSWTCLFLDNARSFARISRDHLAFSPRWIVSHSVGRLPIIHWVSNCPLLWRRNLLLGRKGIWFVRLVHVEVWNVSWLDHCQRIVWSFSLSLLLRSASACPLLRLRPYRLPHTWLNACSINIVRIVRIELTVADLSLVFAESTFLLLSWLSIVEDSIWGQRIVNWLLLSGLLPNHSFILIRVWWQARVSPFMQTVIIVFLTSVLLIDRRGKTAHHHLIGHI